MNAKGKFVISLDFELFWGMRDHKTIQDYGSNILGVWEAIPKMLDLFEANGVAATFATVGFLFAATKEELKAHIPEIQPEYEEAHLSPYKGYLKQVKANESEDKYHFASKLIDLIRQYPAQEIATHTFSHYYCISEGQTITDFDHDLKAAKKIAAKSGIHVQSIVFPRNMFNEAYIEICEKNGIVAYRGTEKVWFHTSKPGLSKMSMMAKKGMRLVNAYLNIGGHHCYSLGDIAAQRPYDIPASRFLRPFDPKLKAFEKLRLRRIKKSMTHAARNGLVFHLWWHPHNFGIYQEENFNFLKRILEHYTRLHEQYGFESVTMGKLAQQLDEVYG